MKKKSKKKNEKKARIQKLKNSPTAASNDKVFDFGGLPNRDLKKNLGC